jgi:chlorobactene glucosyltransferase
MTPFLLALPWFGLLLFVVFWTREPSELPEAPRLAGDATPGGDALPRVSVVVPARNESVNIERCLRSITASGYPDFEVIVVDDRSDDGTGAIARSMSAGTARRLEVIDGEPLPDGWLGKPWACWQGAARATGDLLLFTDADTTHGEALMARAVAGREEERADLLTLVGTQLMETFWERLVQPQVFLVMLLRFPDFERIAGNGRWRDAVANGQYLLFTRAAYEAIGGHEAVADEVVEDLVLAQHVKRAGLALRIRSARADLATRMYRSLRELVEGWSKNLLVGGLQSLPRWMRGVAPPLSLSTGVVLWLVPPVVLVVSAAIWVAGGASAVAATPGADMVGAVAERLADGSASRRARAPLLVDLLVWSTTVCAISVALWACFTRRMGAPAVYGLLYPLGAAVGAYIFARSWMGGRDVRWKGRSYRLRPVSERP